MATDARISTALPSHPKTKKLARRLGPAGPLGCIYLFLWVASNRSDGDLAGMTDEDIELAVDWSGDDGAFVRAMVDVGFIEGHELSRSIHDWAEHNPWAAGAGARSEKSRWAGLCKQHGRAEAARQMPEYAQRIGAAGAQQAGSKPDSATGTNVALPDSATGTPLADSGSAPFLSDSFPSPSPPPTEEEPASPVLGRQFLESQGVDRTHAADWLKVRRAKKAPLTETAWALLKAEADKAGISLDDAVRICAERSWQSLKAEWLKPDAPKARASPPPAETAYQRSMREKVASICPSIAAKAPNEREFIDVTAKTLDREDLCQVDADLRPGLPLALGGA